MPRDATGQFFLPNGTLVNAGQTIRVSQHNPFAVDVAGALSGSLSRDGLGAMRASLDMGGHSVTNVTSGSGSNDLITRGDASLLQSQVRIDGFGDISTPAATAATLSAANVARAPTNTGLLIDRHYTLPTNSGPYAIGSAPVYATASGSIAGSIYLGAEFKYENRIPIAYDDGVAHYNYVLGRKFKRPMEERERPLDGSCIDDRYRLQAIDLTTVETSRWPATTSDVWTLESQTTTIDTVTYALTADSNWHIAWVPVQGGQEVSVSTTSAPTGAAIGLFVRTTKGIEYFYAQPGLQGNLAIKLPTLAPSVTTNVGWLGQGSHDSYEIHNSELTIRAVNSRRYSMLFNGTEIFPARDLTREAPLIEPGEIIAVGFGFFGSAVATPTIKNAVRVTKREQTGLIPLNIGIAGNSISDPFIHGAWESWMREYLDGALGLKVFSITNKAVSGYNSLQIANSISGGALGSSNLCLIVAPEVNDVQQGAAVSVTIGNIGVMLDALVLAGVKPILVTGYLWYSQALASGQGQATTNYAAGAGHRTALRRLAAARGLDYYDLSQTTGPMLATYLATPTVTDPELRDNIHPTARRYMLIGEAMAKVVLRAYAKPMTPRVKDAAIPTGAYSWMDEDNGWTSTDGAYSIDDEGFLSLTGVLTAGTKTDGTTVFTLPPAYRPTRNQYLSLTSDAAATPTGGATLQCQADGACKIYGMDSTATFIRMNGGFFTQLAAR